MSNERELNMSTLTATMFLFQILSVYLAEGILTQSFFYGVEWTSSISTGDLIAGDTMAVHEIALIANNHILEHEPVVTGFQNPSALTDGTHTTSTYPVQHTFSVKWDFDGELLPIDVIAILTNCGDDKPSMFCHNTTLIFNSTTAREVIAPIGELKNIIKVRLVKYENDCRNNTLLLDTKSSITPSCGWECEECLRFLNIDMNALTMNTSSYFPFLPHASSSSQCECPLFTLSLTKDNQLEVWQDDSNFMGAIVPKGNYDRVQISWQRWMGQERYCRQSYLPNTDDFMNVPSFEALELEFIFNHTNGALYEDYDTDQEQIDDFRLDVEEFLDSLFNLTWVGSVTINPTPNASYPTDINTYSYTMDVISYDQMYSHSVLQLKAQYNESYDDILEGFLDLISNSFDTNSTFIENLYGSDEIILSDDDECSSYFLTTTVAPVTDNKEVDIIAIVISVSVASVGCLIASIILLICYKRHLACFKVEWETNEEDKDRDPDYIYQNQKEVGKKGKKKIIIADNSPVKNAVVGKHAAASNNTTKHHPTGSIPLNNAPTYAELRAKSITNHPDDKSITIINANNPSQVRKKLKKGVSELVVVPTDVVPINASIRAQDMNEVPFVNSLRLTPTDVYVESTAFPDGGMHDAKKSYDYSSQRNSRNSAAATHAENNTSYDYKSSARNSGKSGYNYDALSQYSSSPDVDGHYVETPQIQLHKLPRDKLHDIPQNKAIHHKAPQAQSKIDAALNKVKRSKKVIEFTDFDKELKLIKIIGEGSFGKVYKAKWDAEFVAVKIFTNIAANAISTNNIEVASTTGSVGGRSARGTNGNFALGNLEIQSIDDEQYKELYAEIVLATSIPPHPNIVRINGFCRNPLCVVMEFMAGGSVQKLVYGLTKRAAPSVMEKFVILVKSCYGLAKLTEFNLHHRDVAARNILLGDYQTVIDSDTKVKITDFGMTRKDDENTKEIQKTKNDGGPYKWMAPESIQQQTYNEKTDVYMFGITIWEIMFGREPYENMDAINTAMNVCMKNERPEFLWDLPSGLKTLIKKCWDKDPLKRPKFKDVALKLQKLQSNLQNDIDENQAMDKVVEDENATKALNRISSVVSIDQYDEF